MIPKKQKAVRVRFAPSPTGALHVGGARTALFNWLFARRYGGKFILRIEDTDKTRSTVEATKTIIAGLEWLGLDWDEGPIVGGDYGPYHQAERLDIYKEYAQKLLSSGKAYKCFCTPEQLEELRKKQEAKKEAPRYDSRCRNLSEEKIRELENAGTPYVIRFKTPKSGITSVNDLIRGKVEFKNEVLDDFVILKSDGFPTYNFAATVDDHLMEISHVIRGEDHLPNTPKQILLYEAFNFPKPEFAHISMILGKDRSKLSKRHGAASITEYQKMGYLPEAMVNYLARLGWGYGDQEIFSREELIEKFSLDRVVKTPAIFDIEKLNWLNAHYIRKALPERIVDLSEEYLLEAYPDLKEKMKTRDELDYINKVVRCLQDRLVVISDIVSLSEYFFKDEIEYDANGVEKYFSDPNATMILEKIYEKLLSLEKFTKDKIETSFKDLANEMDVKLGSIIHPVRLAITGRTESPGIYDVIEILGKEKFMKRVKKAIEFLKRKSS